jgi:hypothetical protein
MDAAFGGLLSWGVRFSHLRVAVSLLEFVSKPPLVCSLESLVTMVGGTPSCWKMRDDKVSCTSPLHFIG